MSNLCAQQGRGTPANCCGAPACSLTFQTRSGSFALCGIEEYISPSSPPKKYRLETSSGKTYRCAYGGSFTTCHGSGVLQRRFEYTLTGTYSYNSTTCATSGSKLLTVQRSALNPGGACSDPPSVSTSATSSLGPGFPIVDVNFPGGSDAACDQSQSGGPTDCVVTKTSFKYGTGGICVFCNGATYQGESGAMTSVLQGNLSDEDKEDDAIARAGAAWSSCIPAGPSDCSSWKELRGTGVFSASYRQAQFKVNVSGSSLGVVYEATIKLQRRLQGTSDPFVDWIEVFVEFVGTADGNYISDWQPIPCDSGYEVAAVSCVNAIVP